MGKTQTDQGSNPGSADYEPCGPGQSLCLLEPLFSHLQNGSDDGISLLGLDDRIMDVCKGPELSAE